MTPAERDRILIRLDERLRILGLLGKITSDPINRLTDNEFELVLRLMELIQQKNEEN